MTTKIPCKAKDPRTCPYHGQEIKAQEALVRGDGDAYLAAQDAMAKAAHTTPEVQEFFQRQQQPQHYAPAAATFENRFEDVMYSNDHAGVDETAYAEYTVGGHADTLTYEPSTAARRAYQTAAEIIIDHSVHPDGKHYERGMRVIANMQDVGYDLRRKATQADNEGNHLLATTYRSIEKDELAKARIPGGKFFNAREALQNLDDAYWQKPVADNVPEVTQHVDDANRSRVLRIQEHLVNGKPYLVGGMVADVDEAEFTAARLVYQRAANALLAATRRTTQHGVAGGTVVDHARFEDHWQSMADATLRSAALDEIQPAGDLDETRRALEYVHTILTSKFSTQQFGGKTASLPQTLRALDYSYWQHPRGAVAK